MNSVKRADWVRCMGKSRGPVGVVKRVAKDGTWADVLWPGGYVKRMQTKHLVIEHTIEVAGGKLTDLARKRELEDGE